MLALVIFAVLALMAFFAFVLAVMFFAFVLAVMFFAFVMALHALHELDAAQDEVFLLVEAEFSELLPSGSHLFALGLHFLAFSFLLFSQLRHTFLAARFGFAFMLALMFTFMVALMTFTFMLAFVFAFVGALVLFAFLAARLGFTVGFALGLFGFHLGIHFGKEVVSFLVQFGLGGLIQVVPVGIFSLQGAEGAVMLLDNGFRFSGLLRLLGSVVASHHEKAGKTHH